MTDHENYLDKFSETGKPIIKKAIILTTERGQRHLSEAHIIIAFSLLKPQMFNAKLGEANLTAEQVIAAAENRIAILASHTGKGVKVHSSAASCFKKAMARAQLHDRNSIGAMDLLQVLDFEQSSDGDVHDSLEPIIIKALKKLFGINRQMKQSAQKFLRN